MNAYQSRAGLSAQQEIEWLQSELDRTTQSLGELRDTFKAHATEAAKLQADYLALKAQNVELSERLDTARLETEAAALGWQQERGRTAELEVRLAQLQRDAVTNGWGIK